MPLFTVTETPQELFDKAVAHLRQQNAKSLSNESSNSPCAYRGEAGRQCAFGPFIPDEYVFDCEGKVIETLVERDIAAFTYRDAETVADALQVVHDDLEVEDWEAAFAQVAKDHKLVLQARA